MHAVHPRHFDQHHIRPPCPLPRPPPPTEPHNNKTLALIRMQARLSPALSSAGLNPFSFRCERRLPRLLPADWLTDGGEKAARRSSRQVGPSIAGQGENTELAEDGLPVSSGQREPLITGRMHNPHFSGFFLSEETFGGSEFSRLTFGSHSGSDCIESLRTPPALELRQAPERRCAL